MEKPVHSGHRERVRQEFLKNGFTDKTPHHKILEMLLFYSIPRKDTNDLAHELINHFGSLSNVLDASYEQLIKVKGINSNSAVLIKMIMPIARLYLSDLDKSNGIYDKLDDIYRYITNKYLGQTDEIFSVTSFNASGKMLGFDIVSHGDPVSVPVNKRVLFETVLKYKATSVILAHNYPKGSAFPTADDIFATEDLINALKHINIKVIDHIIVTDNDYISMAKSQKLNHLFKEPNEF